MSLHVASRKYPSRSCYFSKRLFSSSSCESITIDHLNFPEKSTILSNTAKTYASELLNKCDENAKNIKIRGERKCLSQLTGDQCSVEYQEVKFCPQQLEETYKDKSKDFFDDATMEHVRHNLFQLSSIEGMVLGGPPSAVTFHSSVIARRVDESGKVNVLLHWEPENLVPDSWVAEGDIISNLEKTIPVSKLPREALQLPFLDALQTAGILSRPGKRKRK